MATMQERLAALREKAAKEPSTIESRAWDPRPGKVSEGEHTLSGIFKARKNDVVRTEHGMMDVVEIEAEDGEMRSVWIGPTTLRNAFDQEAPNPGDLVAVQYHGKRAPKDGGNEYHLFSVAVDRTGEPAPAQPSSPPPAQSPSPAPAPPANPDPPTDQQIKALEDGITACTSQDASRNYMQEVENYLAEKHGDAAAEDPSSAQMEEALDYLRAEHKKLLDSTPF